MKMSSEQKKEETFCEEDTPDVTELRKKFIDEAKESEAEYRKSHLHISLNECLDWMESWGTDHEKPVPQVHR